MSEPIDGIWEIMDAQGRSLVWLAQQIPVSESHLRAMKARKYPPSAEVRRRCAEILQIPERRLFADSEASRA